MDLSARSISDIVPDKKLIEAAKAGGSFLLLPGIFNPMTQEGVWTLAAAFQYLPGSDVLLTIPRVSKLWKSASETLDLWTALVIRDFFPSDYQAVFSLTKAAYSELLMKVRRPDQLIRMQQGALSIYSLTTQEIVNAQDERFASSARFCLTASGRLIITGGKPNNGTRCYLYTPSSHLFSELSQMRVYREYHGMCLCGSTVLVSGGYEIQSESCEVYINSAEVLVGNSWKSIADMSLPRAYHTLVPLQSRVYAVAGMNSSGYLDSIEYLENSVWREVSVLLPEPISDPTAIAIDGVTLLILGGMHEFGFLNSAFEVNFSLNTCTTYSLPVEIYTGNNCITRNNTHFILFNTLKEIVNLTYERGVGIV